MTTATYKVEVSWVGGTAFTGTSDDVTAYVTFMEWRRGRQFASQLLGKALAGQAFLHLNNAGGTFSTQNSNSPIYGSLLPGRAVRVSTTDPTSTVLWRGVVNVIENKISVNGDHKAVLKCVGPLSFVDEREVRIATQTNRLTGSIIGTILDDANWPAAERTIDGGQTTVNYYWVQDKPALDALREIEATESGYIGESKDGKIVFEDRDHRLSGTHIASQGTFTDSATSTLFFTDLTQDDPLRAVRNTFEAETKQYVTDASTVVWASPQTGTASPLVRYGGTLRVEARYPSEQSPAAAVSVAAWGTQTFAVNTQADGGGANITANCTGSIIATAAQSITLQIANTGLVDGYVTAWSVVGTPILALDRTTVRVEDATSQTAYGRRTFVNPAQNIPTIEEAADWGRFQIAIYKDALQILHMTFNANRDGSHMTQALTRDVSDLITIQATSRSSLGISDIFFIEHETHQVDDNKTHWVTWDLSPAAGYGGFWVLNTSELNERTRPSY